MRRITAGQIQVYQTDHILSQNRERVNRAAKKGSLQNTYCHCEPVRRLVWQSVIPRLESTDSCASVSTGSERQDFRAFCNGPFQKCGAIDQRLLNYGTAEGGTAVDPPYKRFAKQNLEIDGIHFRRFEINQRGPRFSKRCRKKQAAAPRSDCL